MSVLQQLERIVKTGSSDGGLRGLIVFVFDVNFDAKDIKIKTRFFSLLDS